MRSFSQQNAGGGLMDTVDRVRTSMKNNNSWEDLWKNDLTPWDLGKETAVLIDELDTIRKDLKKSQKQVTSLTSLVPGCGSGYDLISLVQHHDRVIEELGLENVTSAVVGLDISPTSLSNAGKIINRDGAVPASRTTQVLLKCGDFFDAPDRWESIDSEFDTAFSSFDFIFDYTFFCALPPHLRESWGQRTAELLKPNSGRLLTLIFPILPDAPMEGPPYPVSVDDYRKVLEPHGVFMIAGEPHENPLTVPSRQGKELVALWGRPTESAKL